MRFASEGSVPTSGTTLDTYKLGVLPRPLSIGAVLRRPKERFVMANLLVFKENATKPHEGLSGREAYMQYAATVEQVQGSMGSTMLWIGEIEAQLVGRSEPRFEVGALLEYASPGAFIKAVTSPQSDTTARSAGLEGQWLLACTTEGSSEVPDESEGGVALVELVFQGEQTWRARWREAIEARGGRLLWSGHVDQHVIGEASPGVKRVLLHWLPNRPQLAGLFASDVVQELRASKMLSAPWWVFSARAVDVLPGLK